MGVIAELLSIQNGHAAQMAGLDADFVMGALGDVIDYHNTQLNGMLSSLVADTTTKSQRLFFPRLAGKMLDGQSGANRDIQRIVAQYTVGFPLYETYATLEYTQEQWAYLTVEEFERQVLGVLDADKARQRAEIWRALTRSSNVTFTDKINGSITVKPLANNDTDEYPNLLGADVSTLITHDHVYHTGFVSSAIDATTGHANNIVETLIDDLEEHFGASEGGSNIVIFAATDVARDIASIYGAAGKYVAISDRFIQEGANTDTIAGRVNVPGKLMGRLTDGAWLVHVHEFNSGYAYAQHLDVTPPLTRRVDTVEASQIMPYGLHITVAHADNPLRDTTWIRREGYGVSNRLNGVSVRFHATTYADPTFVG